MRNNVGCKATGNLNIFDFFLNRSARIFGIAFDQRYWEPESVAGQWGSRSLMRLEEQIEDPDVRIRTNDLVELWVHYSDATAHLYRWLYGIRRGEVEEVFAN